MRKESGKYRNQKMNEKDMQVIAMSHESDVMHANCEHTTMSFPAFSGLFAISIAAAAAPPDDIPTCSRCSHN